MKKNFKLLNLFVLCGMFLLGFTACSDENDEPQVPTTDLVSYNTNYYSELLRCSQEGTLSFKEYYSLFIPKSRTYLYELHIPAEGGKYELSLNEGASWVGDEPNLFPPFSKWHSHMSGIEEYSNGFENGRTENDKSFIYTGVDNIYANEAAKREAPFGYVTTGFSKIVFDVKPNEKSSERYYMALFQFNSIEVDDSSIRNFYNCADVELYIYQGAR